MKNVLHLIDTFGTGGAESVYLQLLGRLDRRRYRSFAAVLGSGWLRDSVIDLGYEPLDTRTEGSLDLSYLKQLRDLVRTHRIDIIQTHLLTTAVYGSVAGRLAGVPVVSTFHGINDVKGRFLTLKSAAIGYGASRIVFVSEFLRRAIVARERFLGAKSTVIYNGVDVRRFSPRRDFTLRRQLGIADDETLVGAVGRIIHAKGFDVLIRAADILRHHPAKFRFLIIGEKLEEDATDEDLIALRSSLGLDREVHILPFRTDIERVFDCIDLFVLSSRTEGFSLTTIEAMASGLPVVATASGGPQEIVTPDSDALLVPTDDPASLARAIAVIAENASLRERLRAQARETAVRRFSLDATISAYEALYDSL